MCVDTDSIKESSKNSINTPFVVKQADTGSRMSKSCITNEHELAKLLTGLRPEPAPVTDKLASCCQVDTRPEVKNETCTSVQQCHSVLAVHLP